MIPDNEDNTKLPPTHRLLAQTVRAIDHLPDGCMVEFEDGSFSSHPIPVNQMVSLFAIQQDQFPAGRYRALATTLLGEALERWAQLMLHPEGPTGQLQLKLAQLQAALRMEPFQVLTEWERRLQEDAKRLLDLAEKVVNDQKHGLVTDSTAELAKLVAQHRGGG
jgi:hypothetical protein